MKKRVGLYFGSFDPVHIGHLIIANYMVHYTDLDEVWFVVTPLNPLKKDRNLIEDHHRLQMVHLAIRKNESLKASDVEFDLPKPNYTVNTLKILQEQHPDFNFSLIMGEDNLRNFLLWKDYEKITRNYPILVYPRDLTDGESRTEDDTYIPPELAGADITVCDAPLMKISSTFIRQAIRDEKDVRYLIPDEVVNYISNNYFYENTSE